MSKLIISYQKMRDFSPELNKSEFNIFIRSYQFSLRFINNFYIFNLKKETKDISDPFDTLFFGTPLLIINYFPFDFNFKDYTSKIKKNDIVQKLLSNNLIFIGNQHFNRNCIFIRDLIVLDFFQKLVKFLLI